MKNKNMTQIETIKSVRKTWGFDPTTRVVKDKTKYARKQKFNKGWE